MVCFMYRRGCVGKMTWSLLSCNRVVCLCVCVSMEPTGMKHWSQGSTQETWMILVSMFSSLDQQDNLLETWCVPLSFVLFRCSRDLFFSVWWSYLFCVEVGEDKEESWQHTPNKSNLFDKCRQNGMFFTNVCHIWLWLPVCSGYNTNWPVFACWVLLFIDQQINSLVGEYNSYNSTLWDFRFAHKLVENLGIAKTQSSIIHCR